jgi:hypothetical protein
MLCAPKWEKQEGERERERDIYDIAQSNDTDVNSASLVHKFVLPNEIVLLLSAYE